jgi:hypothetical protein
MKKIIVFQILILIFSLTSCDKVYLYGLEVINETNDSLYYCIHPYKNLDYKYNIAYNVFAVQNNNNEIKYKYVIDYKNDEDAIRPNEIKKPSSFKISWKNFSKNNNGLTIVFYKKETLQKMKPLVPLTEENIYKRIDLTYEELEKNNYIVRLK